MFKRFYPKKFYKSTYEIDYKKFYDKGIRGILFDVDNTLVPHNAKADDRAIKLMQDLKSIGFKICLLSNNNENRVVSFNNHVNVECVYNAFKPSRKKYYEAMEKIGTDIENTLFIGDQIFTDIWGANRVGIYSILVGPVDTKEDFQIVLKRFPERLVMASYKKHKSDK